MSFRLIALLITSLFYSCSDIPTENKIFKQNPINLLEILNAKTYGTTPLIGNTFVQNSQGINKKTLVTIYFDEWFNLQQFSTIDFDTKYFTIADSTVMSKDFSYRLKVSDISVNELTEISIYDLRSKYLGVDADFKFGIEFQLYSGHIPVGTAYYPASTEYHITDIQLLATLK